MSTLKSNGIIRTSLGDYYIFPCECESSWYLATRKRPVDEGKYHKPFNVKFETDYIYEQVDEDVEIRD